MAKQITNVPQKFIEYVTYIENLKFDEIPNYMYIKSLFEVKKVDMG
jgi:hypothetical protein